MWYFNLKPAADWCYFPREATLREAGYRLEKDEGYESEQARQRDLAWRAFQHGFIASRKENGLDAWKKVKLPVADEYRFIRKNFHPLWGWYILLVRLLTFKNPFREIRGFWQSRHAKREDFSKNYFEYPAYENFQSGLIAQKPLVSVIVPTLNRYEYLRDVFKDLENQTYKNFEVIVVDQTDDFRKDFYKGWNLDLKYWYQQEKALWRARNEAVKASRGSYVLLYDDDSRVAADWIEHHLKALDFFNADLSGGVSISKAGAEVPVHYRFFRWSEQLDTGNVLLKKEIFEKTGLFDRQFEKQRMGDGEFGLRCYLAGFRNISNPFAKRFHLKVAQGGLRQMGSWDGWRPKKWLAPRPVPSVLYLARKYFGDKAAFWLLLRQVFPSYVPYKFKKNRYLKLLSFLMLPFLLPLMVFQVSTSWHLAGKKLKEGAKIPSLA